MLIKVKPARGPVARNAIGYRIFGHRPRWSFLSVLFIDLFVRNCRVVATNRTRPLGECPLHAAVHLLARTDFPSLKRRAIETLQLNLGYRSNQSCVHCHVNAGPHRTEERTD